MRLKKTASEPCGGDWLWWQQKTCLLLCLWQLFRYPLCQFRINDYFCSLQVGILKRVVVIDLYDDKGPIVLINPVILKTKGEHEVDEGCLSFPNQFAKIVRPEEVTAEYTDRNGKRVKVKAKDLLAQAICHELDHLDGEVFIDKIIPGTLEYVEPEK